MHIDPTKFALSKPWSAVGFREGLTSCSGILWLILVAFLFHDEILGYYHQSRLLVNAHSWTED